MKEKITLNYKKKKISLELKKVGFFKKGWGLMFSRREKANALLFDFKKSVNFVLTSLFVFYPFIAIWIDEKNKIIDLKVIKPFKFSIVSPKKFKRLIEIPINKKYDEVLTLLVGN